MNPTKKQKIMLDFIEGFVRGNGYSPTLREIMRALDYKSVSTVAKHVDNLIARGWLIKRDGEARSLEVVTDTLPVNSEELRSYVLKLANQKIANPNLTDEDKKAIKRTLELLGFVEEGA